MPEEHKPTAIHVFVHSEESLNYIESFLNQKGKTMKFSKSKNPPASGLPFLLKPLIYFALIGAMTQPTVGYGTLVRDLK